MRAQTLDVHFGVVMPCVYVFLEIVEMKADNHLYCYGLEHPILSFEDDTTVIKPEDIDTIILNIKLTETSDIDFE